MMGTVDGTTARARIPKVLHRNGFAGGSRGARTRNLRIKSPQLYH